jgi:hypothetical protein
MPLQVVFPESGIRFQIGTVLLKLEVAVTTIPEPEFKAENPLETFSCLNQMSKKCKIVPEGYKSVMVQPSVAIIIKV